MNGEDLLKRSQEQAVAAAVQEQYAQRVLDQITRIGKEETNLENANEAMTNAMEKIESLFNGDNGVRGGSTGVHGFIAEYAEVGIGNARSLVEGESAKYYTPFIENGDVDVYAGDVPYQLKTYVNFKKTLEAMDKHAADYPDYLKLNGKYMSPRDQYERIKTYMEMPKEEANLLNQHSHDGELSLSEWKWVHKHFGESDIKFEDIDPHFLNYDEVQADTYKESFEKEQRHIEEINKKRKDQIYDDTKPTLEAGLKTAVASSAIEGSMTLTLEIVRRLKSGKKIRDFDEQDWDEIFSQTGYGFIKGGARGGFVYYMTNVAHTHASAASALVTAAFGVAGQVHQFRNGNINEETLVSNSEMVCLDASVTAVSSFLGQTLIPVPIFGAIIGNCVGTMMYQMAKDNFSGKEQEIIKQYLEEQRILDERLDKQYKECIDELNKNYSRYLVLLDEAFSPNVETAFLGSIQLARSIGLEESETIDSIDEAREYFLS